MIDARMRQHEVMPDSLLHYLAQRDAALWIDRGFDDTDERAETVARIIALPWRLVVCESTSSALADRLAEHTRQGSAAVRIRGFLTIVASDPAELTLAPRSLPVFFLNGLDRATTREESANLGAMSSMARRVNSLRRLLGFAPHAILVLTNRPDELLSEYEHLWNEEGFRANLSLASESDEAAGAVKRWLAGQSRPPLVDVVTGPIGRIGPDLVSRAESLFPERGVSVRLVEPDGNFRSLDISDCELAEQPLLDRYDIIQETHLRPLLPDELSEHDFNAFFDRSKLTWAPFAAGLPWNRFPSAERGILRELELVRGQGSQSTHAVKIVSEPGAGGTTLARQLGYVAAAAGFPTLVAKQTQFRPDLTEVSRFLLRVRNKAVGSSRLPGDDMPDGGDELPWLLIYDVQHWQARETDLLAFVRALAWEGRSAVVLVVAEAPAAEPLQNVPSVVHDVLTHELTQEEARALGSNLNRYLRSKKRDRSPEEWDSFWQANTPRVGTLSGVGATFWIALEFWIKRQLDLGQSIQSWLYGQFTRAELTDGVRRTVLSIAALGIERIAMPDVLVPASPSGELPFSYVLSEARRSIPALGLNYSATATERYWNISHPLLARYLVNSASRDRDLLLRLNLPHVTDPVELRLALIRGTTTAGAMSRRALLPLALELAMTVLKLDREGGNYEFFTSWRDVLEILEEMPDSVWNSSRAFNHHVAISRRRVAVDTSIFDISDEERQQQLQCAVEHLEYAINDIPRSDDDERDLNLLNSLARAYLDLATVAERLGASHEDTRKLRENATAAARAAHAEDPTNSYVLETLARDLIHEGRLYPDKRIENACVALGHLFQAMSLESAPMRQARLRDLIDQALSLLTTPDAHEAIDELCRLGNPFGYMARACAILGRHLAGDIEESATRIPTDVLDQALAAVGEAPEDKRNWAILKLEYDLATLRYPHDFERQLNILDVLEGTDYRPTAQEQLERAILLHQVGRHTEGNDSFAELRRRLQRSEVLVRVPGRLRTLFDLNRRPRTCQAKVVAEAVGYRAQAEVLDLKRVKVPFVPQDWGVRQKKLGEKFYCAIIFGPKGPMARPPITE